MKLGKRKEEDKKGRISIVTQENIKDFLHGIDESISPLVRTTPEKVRDPLLKESQIWFDNTINVGQSMDGNSFRAGAVYGIYQYVKQLTDGKLKRKDQYIV